MPEIPGWKSPARRLSLEVKMDRANRGAGLFLSSVAALAGRFGSRMNVGESWIPADLIDMGEREVGAGMSLIFALADLETVSDLK